MALIFTAFHSQASEVPAKLQSAIFIKVLGFNKSLSGDLTIYVVDNPAVEASLKKAIGRKIGNAKIAKVLSGPIPPSSKVSVIYCSSPAKFDEVSNYCKKHKTISISGNESMIKKGLTLGVGVVGGKPKVLLNKTSSKNEGVKWNPAILKLAKVY